MKLVELLARELDVWPDNATHAIQEDSGTVEFTEKGKPGIKEGSWSVLANDADGPCLWLLGAGVNVTMLATDHATAIITRAAWEAERARIAKPLKTKWIRHRGGKCPVEAGVLVDLKMRGGVIHIGKFCENHAWIHSGRPFDIMAYRICEPVQVLTAPEPEPLTVDEWQAVIGHPDGPLEWRDRIHTIDFDIAAQNEAHRLAIETLEEERVSLVQRLAEEGLQLVGVAAVPAEDMGDWRNWKDGDLVECVSTEGAYPAELTLGNTYEIRDGGAIDDEGDNMDYCVKHGNCFKWHSRPTA